MEDKTEDPYADLRDTKPWQEMIEEAEKCFAKYQETCDNIDRLYSDLDYLAKTNVDREFQIFWANLEVLKPSVYARPPKPVVSQRYRQDRKELPRRAADLLERSLDTSFDLNDIDGTMRLVRDDLVTNARGVVWPIYTTRKDEAGNKVSERVSTDHVDRKDFLHEPARKWAEVGWVARRSWLTRDKGVKRFGDVFNRAEFKDKDTDKEETYKGEKKAPVWELWHKGRNLVVWVSPDIDKVLDIQPPFLDLEGFFPCPRPAYGTVQRRTLIPVPDFVYYRDQVEEINELTARISALSEAIRMKGFYAAGASDLADSIEAALKGNDNRATLIPVPFAAVHGSSLKDGIVWLPVQEVAVVVRELVNLRRQLIDDVYQITGLSDVMRGSTEASETATAQQLKSQYGSVRVRDRQNELIRIARDVAAITGEIMAENFEAQTLLDMSQVSDLPSQASIDQKLMEITSNVSKAAQSPMALQMAQTEPEKAQKVKQAIDAQVKALKETVTIEKVMQLLRDQRMRPFVLDIETDSTIQPDENAAKQRASEFMTAVGGFMGQAVPMVQADPESAELATEMLKFVASQFRAGRPLDEVIDRYAQNVKDRAGQPKPPSPDQIKAEADAKAKMAKAETEKMDAETRRQEAVMELQKGQVELREMMVGIRKMLAEIGKIEAETVDTLRPDNDREVSNG